MSKVKPSLAKGTRDFGALEMQKRNYIFSLIRSVFEKYGFQPLETPAMENLSTLTGKYGEEGDKLLFKILNSGDYLSKADKHALDAGNSQKLAPSIAEKGLRYDLTIPLARYVVMNQHALTFPFKRYQIQPVWRADRPQKGRYREFYQCDVDVIGSDALLNEAELTLIYAEVFEKLKIPSTILLNNRKLLAGLAEKAGVSNQLTAFTIALDKLDKIGEEGVKKELNERGIPESILDIITSTAKMPKQEKLAKLKQHLSGSSIGTKGVEEMEQLLTYLNGFSAKHVRIEFDLSLARGLDYYTGTIFEVKPETVSMGSIGGGGRYDNLTGVFGLQGMSGVGVSFGAERIYDIMEELKLFPESVTQGTQVLFVNFGGKEELAAFNWVQTLRSAGISAEVYPSSEKIKKQMKYADQKKVSYVVFAGEEEVAQNKLKLKNMQSGEEKIMTIDELIRQLAQA